MISLYLPSETKMGVGYQAHAMANTLVSRGHCVTLFTPCAKPADAQYTLHPVNVGNSLRTFRFAWNLRKIDFSGFQIIHAHGDNYWLWSRRRRPPIVRTMHGSCLVEAKNIPGLKEKLRMSMLYLTELMAVAAADKTVAVSSNTLKYYPGLHTVIPNGVDVAAFSPAANRNAGLPPASEQATPPPPDNGKSPVPAILFVGTYANRKRGKLLMEIFARDILPKLPDAQLWMVCSDAPAAAGVTIFGRIPEHQLTDLYRRAWVFCLPSTYEGFGIPYIEAMASGTAVVASPNVGAVEVTRHGQDGLIAPDDKLGESLLRVLTDETLRHKLEAAGLERVKEFDLNSVCKRYEEIYQSLINARQHA